MSNENELFSGVENENLSQNIEIDENSQPEENLEENLEQQDTRPPVDPKNKLYTFWSILIFAACYSIYLLITNTASAEYSLYNDCFTDTELSIIEDVLDYDNMPDEITVKSARLNKGFDGNMLYIELVCSLSLDSFDEDEDDESSIADYLPFTSGDAIEDERFAIYISTDDFRVDYVYADEYVDIINPSRMCIVYEYNGETIIQLRTTDYTSAIEKAFSSGVKIEYD